VTEQDVINEEMYEEEDDGLPLQFRRLTAHLQTNSADFNRRLAAYLTNQVAMRSAMEQMVNNSYSQPPYPTQPQYAGQPQQAMYNSPLMKQHVAQSPSSVHRSTPYPNPHQPGFRQTHVRAYSVAALDEISSNEVSGQSQSMASNTFDGRRLSTPANIPSSPGRQSVDVNGIKPDPDYQRQTLSATPAQPQPLTSNFPPVWQDMGPFTTSLPPEAQQLLGPGLDPNDPFTSVLMAGSETYTSSPYYPWGNAQGNGKLADTTITMNPPCHGMSTTLAPSVLEPCTDVLPATKATTPLSNDNNTVPSFGLGLNSSQESKIFDPYSCRDSTQGLVSGQVTPAEGFWDSFVQDGDWSEEATTT
jgi:hypothetical protein